MRAKPLMTVPYREGDMTLLRKGQKIYIAQALRELAEIYAVTGASRKRKNDLDFAAYCFEELAKEPKK